MSELMSRGLNVVCSQQCLSPTPCSPPPISPPPHSTPTTSPPPISPPLPSPTPPSPPHASPSHLQRFEKHMTGVEAQLIMIWQQQVNIMDVLKSLQSDMLSFKSIVEDKRARSSVITLVMATRAEETPLTDSPDGFVCEVTWAGSLEVPGWTKVARMVPLSPVREEEIGSTESTPEAETDGLDSDRGVDSDEKRLQNLINPLPLMVPHILMAMGVQTDTATQWNIVRTTEFHKQSLSGECGVYAVVAAAFTLAEQNVYTLNDALVAAFGKFCTCSLWSQTWILD
ncbi:hypothetical protein F511_18098 [Dorcoceras hygrometricum]|uniref:Ubiquitin-like protease family profile domain-containing protein n=1 Tax=Dorcoceras hygrometricum TaxID=472368 RepID=A0A2Z7BHD1_9LAMI|nr:hypothetical protein F511_18098 [Dorcoceras hygrometricum]